MACSSLYHINSSEMSGINNQHQNIQGKRKKEKYNEVKNENGSHGRSGNREREGVPFVIR